MSANSRIETNASAREKAAPYHWFDDPDTPEAGGAQAPVTSKAACGSWNRPLYRRSAKQFVRVCEITRVYASSMNGSPRPFCEACLRLAESKTKT